MSVSTRFIKNKIATRVCQAVRVGTSSAPLRANGVCECQLSHNIQGFCHILRFKEREEMSELGLLRSTRKGDKWDSSLRSINGFPFLTFLAATNSAHPTQGFEVPWGALRRMRFMICYIPTPLRLAQQLCQRRS